MLDVQFITTLDMPGLEPYRALRQSKEHLHRGIFIAEGEKVVRRLLESSLKVISLLLPEKWLDSYRPLLTQRKEDITVYVTPKSLLEQMTGFSFYQGVLGIGQVPSPLPLDAVLLPRKPHARLLIAADGVTSAQNLGSLSRNGAAFGVDGMIVGETACHPYLGGAVRSSMGAIFKIPVHHSADLAETLSELKQRGIRCIAAHPHTENRTLSSADFHDDCCIVFGSEGCGLSPLVLEACDQQVAIPMSSGVDSLNIATAAAVFLHEIHRQRNES
jgi:tRNA G18 (ribose-2'-O)-methylase SpoU